MDTLDCILTKYDLKNHDKKKGWQSIALPIIRSDFGTLFHELGFKVGVEIGVETGHFSKSLCSTNEGVKHYSIDAWKAYHGYRDHVDQEKLDGFFAKATERLSKYNCTIIRKFSLDAVKDFEDNSLDYVYIDGNHDFQNCTNDIVEWGKKVKVGGIISGHDFDKHHFSFRSRIHVNECVTAYTYAYGIYPWFTTKSETGNARSFLWVKK